MSTLYDTCAGLVSPHFSVTFSRAFVLYFGANHFLIPGANDVLMTFVVMASAAPSPACLACGELSQKRDRRVIGGSNTSEAIILQSRKQEIALDRLLSPGLGYICRKCHYAYDKLLKAEDVCNSSP